MGPLPPRRSLRPGLTVDERRRMNGGFIAGPGNRMAGAAMPGLAAALASSAPRAPVPSAAPGIPLPRQTMLPAAAGLAPAGAGGGEAAGEDAAPNLREGQPGRECMSCKHYDLGEGHCEMYDFHPQPVEVCDSYSKASSKAPEGEMRPSKPRGAPPAAAQPKLPGPY